MPSKKKPRYIIKGEKKLKIFQLVLGLFIVGVSLVSFALPTLLPQTVEIVEAEDQGVSNSKYQLSQPSLIPIQSESVVPPELSARAVFAFDPDSNITLFESNADSQQLPASTTKIMTALVAIESYELDKLITITEEERTIGNTMKLKRGEILSVEDLLSGLLISSGNDAGLALALAYPDTGYPGFVAVMNQKALDLSLSNLSFRNVSGVESYNHYVSAKDLALLTFEAMKNPVFAELVATQEKVVTSRDDSKTIHPLRTTNQLLGKVDGVVGVKTGWTENAGECLVTYVERDGKKIILVVLGSTDRFGESELLIEWLYQNYNWVNPRNT